MSDAVRSTRRTKALTQDAAHNEHLVFGMSWTEVVALPSWMADSLGRSWYTRHIGPDDVRDELLVLELGSHVEMECALQEAASRALHRTSTRLGAYLSSLFESYDLERETDSPSEPHLTISDLRPERDVLVKTLAILGAACDVLTASLTAANADAETLAAALAAHCEECPTAVAALDAHRTRLDEVV
jgi:hypothetical protein